VRVRGWLRLCASFCRVVANAARGAAFLGGVAHTLTPAQADALAARLELDLDDGICHARLCVVSFALGDGSAREISSALRRMTPDLWDDGLDVRALTEVQRARRDGVPHAEAALADLQGREGRSVVARAIVRRLAAELSDRARTKARVKAIARDRLQRAPPERN
jgi:hypothetical protein